MKTLQACWTKSNGWRGLPDSRVDSAQLVLALGEREVVARPERWRELRSTFPAAHIVGCSTCGEIAGSQIAGIEVSDEGMVATAVTFEHSSVSSAEVRVRAGESRSIGRELAEALVRRDLVHVLVFSDGVSVNGSELVRGLTDALPKHVAVTGGLAGDGPNFERTVVIGSDGPSDGLVRAVGLYGDRLSVGYGSMGGWSSFGPERLITRSEDNRLYEFDNRSALSLYREYLGEHAAGLPASALLFPLSVRSPDRDVEVVRTVLGIDEEAGFMTVAGDVPAGWLARLMQANVDRLVDGAMGAGRAARLSDTPVELALLISCVGRKMVMKQRVEEEVEAVADALGSGAAVTGFYSYGELSPSTAGARCELHNQTMTVTTFSEV